MQENLDLISSFPDDILGRILNFLPMKDAVRTSVLSTRWRYLFESMSTLDFGESSFVTRRSINSFKNCVDRLLYFPNYLSLECFRLTRLTPAYSDYLSGWICAALCRGVKEIDLHLYPFGRVMTLLFTCQSLWTLKLNVGFSVIKVPSTACLPNLKTLHLRDLVLTDGSISRLISSCHVLEDLVLSVFECDFDNKSELSIQNLSLKSLVLDFDVMGSLDFGYVIVIDAPSLVYFHYIGYIAADYTLSNMTSLGKAVIRTRFYNVYSEASVIRLLQGLCNVRSLDITFNGDEGKLFQAGIRPVLEFHNLIELEFHNPPNRWKGMWLVEFLHCVPNLKTLFLKGPFAGWNSMSVPKQVPSCLSSHIKEIIILDFMGRTDMFEMICYFLDNATVLEKIKIGMGASYEGERSRVVRKLFSLRRNSNKIQLVDF